MKISIEAKVLAKAMKNAASILAATEIIPICANVRLTADGKVLEIVTCDLELEYRQNLPLSAKGEMAATVNAKKLLAIANTAPADAVLGLSLGDGRMTITAGRGRWVLPTLPATDFPTLPVEGLGNDLEIAGTELGKALRRTEWAVYEGRAQLHLQGTYCHAEAGKLRFATANGTSMAIVTTDTDFPADAPDAMLPAKLADTLASLAVDCEGPVKVAWDDRKLRAQIGDSVLTGKLMETTFPDYRRVIPALDASPLIADPASIAEALRRIMVVADEKSRCVKLDRAGGKFTIASDSGASGVSDEEVPADCADGFATGINGQFLGELLAAIGGDSIEIHQADARAPLLFRRVVDDGAMAIVMPMKL